MTLDARLLAALDAVVLEIQSLSHDELKKQLALSQESVFAQTIDEIMSVLNEYDIWSEDVFSSNIMHISDLNLLVAWKLVTNIPMSDYNFTSANDSDFCLAA
ncbi:hypothetical protein [Acinetobacter towneri]|uniref:hypothetical protein n=1 Tax=Acinetobacter towneri TaxID=202956 RepID=UPI002097279E|nr:hypothetical protein [Acinetobacter towneri]MCO8048017.1 hypothetical protein [Acinetobacter towneri]